MPVSKKTKRLPNEFHARGRTFSRQHLERIAEIVQNHFSEGRTEISQRVCRALRWRQRNGRLKEVACREVLRKLDELNLICLPPPITQGAVWLKEPDAVQFDGDTTEITKLNFRDIRITVVRPGEDMRLWNQLVSTYHYLCSSRIVGRQLKYMVYYLDRPLACMGWGEAAWAISDRDKWIGWTPTQRERNLHRIVNNVRFLILPWVHVPNLASFLLGQFKTIVPKDWNEIYGYPPVLLETFVDVRYFRGTCYKAANWIELGLTAGYAKVGASHHNSQKPKALFVYPVCQDFKRRLRGR